MPKNRQIVVNYLFESVKFKSTLEFPPMYPIHPVNVSFDWLHQEKLFSKWKTLCNRIKIMLMFQVILFKFFFISVSS